MEEIRPREMVFQRPSLAIPVYAPQYVPEMQDISRQIRDPDPLEVSLPPSPEPREMQDIFYEEVQNDSAPEDKVMEENPPIPGPSKRPDLI